MTEQQEKAWKLPHRCHKCRAKVPDNAAPLISSVFQMPRWTCEKHAAMAEADKAARATLYASLLRDERLDAWRKTAPNFGSPTRRAEIPEYMLAHIDEYEYNTHGFGFISKKSGKRKSRTMVLLLERLTVDENKSCLFVPMVEFCRKASVLSSDDFRGYSDYIESIINADAVLLDDLGKGKMTERVQQSMHDVIDGRTWRGKPIFFTMNATWEEFGAMLMEDLRDPILRRLGEFCEVVTV